MLQVFCHVFTPSWRVVFNKIMSELPLNLMEVSGMGQGRSHLILVQIRIRGRIQELVFNFL